MPRTINISSKTIKGRVPSMTRARDVATVRVVLDMASFKATTAGLIRTSRALRGECRQALARTLESTEEYARMLAPEGETKALRDGISSRMLAATLEGIVESRARHSIVVDKGAKPHPILPRRKKALTIPYGPSRGDRNRTARQKRSVEDLGSSLIRHRSPMRHRMMRRPTATQKMRKMSGMPTHGREAFEPMKDVHFILRRRVDHPGFKGRRFFRRAAIFANRMIEREVNVAVANAILKGASMRAGMSRRTRFRTSLTGMMGGG